MLSIDLAKQFLSDVGLAVREYHRMPGRDAIFAPVPDRLDSRVADLLRERFPTGLWKHQARAIEQALAGESVCIATQTASGKSLIFMAVAAHRLLTQPDACVLALYPARALIQDQILKWRTLLEPLGLTFGFIDGGIPVERRSSILRANRLLLMTPDVAHAWLLPNCGEVWARSFLERLSLLILDEAHVYEGVFGTNFAYLMRRLLAMSSVRQVLAASATLGEPEAFLRQLTGLPMLVLGPAEDGAPVYEKTILLVGESTSVSRWSRSADDFKMIVEFLRRLVDAVSTPFIAFADSRRMVEQLVSALYRHSSGSDGDSDEEDAGEPASVDNKRVLPYRAGYEETDRDAIQASLASGTLRGVVSTSALELGIDIGHIDVVAMLQPPPTRKAFWQRLGRTGRTRPGFCIVLDLDNRYSCAYFLGGGSEPNHLYLENRYLQYANVLCAAAELASIGGGREMMDRYVNVPSDFLRLLENELEPTEPLPPELAVLKRRAQPSGPHLEFPLRNAIEEVFDIHDGSGHRLGQVTYTQAIREAYPGAVYYYLATPYRVVHFNFRTRQIEVRREKRYTTRPDLLQLAFPRWPDGLLALWRDGEGGFVAECEMQVSEKLLGFIEQRGSAREQYRYEPGSVYYQRPLLRFFETTGVAWFFPNVRLNEDLAQLILSSFCDLCGVQERDVALGLFHAKRSPLGDSEVSGWCIYDSTYGSLRLTQQLATRFHEIVWEALQHCVDDPACEPLWQLAEAVERLSRVNIPRAEHSLALTDNNDWFVVIARGEQAIYFKAEATEEVRVRDFRYTPKGIVYVLEPDNGWDTRLVPAEFIKPLNGTTKLIRWNVMTGEEQPLDG
ncbi:MAG: DEAD/DEAH box helicase [Thermorudis peleae]|nr:DEAD/DEAH box helicase [Thermorudis peleae]